MGKTAVIFTCAHSTPSVSNDRAVWLGKFLYDLRPDYVVDLGDTADMVSLSSHDTRYPEKMVASKYGKDIEHHLDFQEKVRHKFKQMKKKRPAFYGFEGNHENRIRKAIAHDPRLEDTKYGISFSHLQTDHFYDEYHPYHCSAPAVFDYDGVSYAHYIGAGNFGTAMSGVHHAASLLNKRHCSTTVGHSHKRSLFFKDDAHPHPTIGLVAGCFKGGDESWAGQANKDWWKGVVIKRNIDNGSYSPQFVSLEELKKEYS